MTSVLIWHLGGQYSRILPNLNSVHKKLTEFEAKPLNLNAVSSIFQLYIPHALSSCTVSDDLATDRFEVTFAPGVMRVCGRVRVVDDRVVEGEEMVAFNISSSAGSEDGPVMYLVGERAQVVMVIRDDDSEWLYMHIEIKHIHMCKQHTHT